MKTALGHNWLVQQGQLDCTDVKLLLAEHLADMYRTSPEESVHALDLTSLKHESISFWVLRDGKQLAGCAALKQLTPKHGELKSMRTHKDYLRQGVAGVLLENLIQQAKVRGYQRLSLETGSMDFFKPARRLYQRHGFTPCQAFAQYQPDPNSVFMTLTL